MTYPYQGITPDEYQREALRTEKTPPFVDAGIASSAATREHIQIARLVHGMIGVATEAGELQDMVKKSFIYGKPLDAVNVLEECGDLLWYIALALDSCGFKMSDCMQANIDKLRVRFPGKFTAEKANTRDLDAERAALEGGHRCTSPHCCERAKGSG